MLLLRRTEERHAKHRTAFATDNVAAVAASPTDAIERSERAALVRLAIERLPQQQRTAVTLRHLEEMSYERIAEIMEITPSTARVHVRAAREAMRQAIVKRAPEFGRRRTGQ